MASTYAAALSMLCTVTETLGLPGLAASDKGVTENAYNLSSLKLDADSTPPVTAVAAGELALSGGAGTLDLTNLLSPSGQAVSGNGLKIIAILLKNKAGNSNVMTVGKGASNGYGMNGGAAWSIPLPAVGGESYLYFGNQASTIGSSAKTIDVAGTLAQVLQYVILMG
jgi:hypothetical protein